MGFEEGGLDISGEQVLDWDKLTWIEPNFYTESEVNNKILKTVVGFNGFFLTNGTNEDLNLVPQWTTGSWEYVPEYIAAEILYVNSTTTISVTQMI